MNVAEFVWSRLREWGIVIPAHVLERRDSFVQALLRSSDVVARSLGLGQAVYMQGCLDLNKCDVEAEVDLVGCGG